MLTVNTVTDTLFKISPDTGHPLCTCSRCGDKIPENDCCIRVFVNEGRDGEYRYCEACQQASGITIYKPDEQDYWDFDPY